MQLIESIQVVVYVKILGIYYLGVLHIFMKTLERYFLFLSIANILKLIVKN